MATITSNGTGGGNWSAGSTWQGGTPPSGTDDVVIQSGDTVAKDTAKGSPDCVALTVNGVLAIGGNGLKFTGAFSTSGGKITGGAGGELEMTYGSTLSFSGCQTEFIGSSGAGNQFKLLLNTSAQVRFFGGYQTASAVKWSFVDIEIPSGGTTLGAQLWTFKPFVDYVRDCWFDTAVAGLGITTDDNYSYVFERCFFSGGNHSIRPENGCHIWFYDCEFGYHRDGTADAPLNGINFLRQGAVGYCFNCKFNVTTDDLDTDAGEDVWGYSVGHNQVPGAWKHGMYGGWVEKTTGAKKSGNHGIELEPSSHCAIAHPVVIDIPIPCDSGDSFSSLAIYLQIVSAGADFSGSAGDIVLTLDPGDEWGLKEEQEPNYGTEDAWQQITFTGGNAGGTGKKGSSILRVELKKYVASAKVYLADMTGAP